MCNEQLFYNDGVDEIERKNAEVEVKRNVTKYQTTKEETEQNETCTLDHVLQISLILQVQKL